MTYVCDDQKKKTIGNNELFCNHRLRDKFAIIFVFAANEIRSFLFLFIFSFSTFVLSFFSLSLSWLFILYCFLMFFSKLLIKIMKKELSYFRILHHPSDIRQHSLKFTFIELQRCICPIKTWIDKLTLQLIFSVFLYFFGTFLMTSQIIIINFSLFGILMSF